MPTGYSWTDLDPADFVAGKPITFEEFQAVIKNFYALAEAASGAPELTLPDLPEIYYQRTTDQTMADDLDITWPTRSNTEHTDDDTEFTAPSAGWYAIDSWVQIDEGSTVESLYEFRLNNDPLVEFSNTDIDGTGVAGSVITNKSNPALTAILHLDVDDVNATYRMAVAGTVYLAEDDALKWRCVESPNPDDKVQSGSFRVRKLR